MSSSLRPTIRSLRHRPLLTAAAGVVGGALAARTGADGLPVAAMLLLLASSLLLRWPHALLAATSIAAGVGAGAREALATRRACDAMSFVRPRGPPTPAEAILRVESVDEDPFRGRCRLLGRRADGLGILCLWEGRCPEPVAPGALLRARGRAFVPLPARNPGERDAALSLAARGASLVLDLRVARNILLLAPAPPRPAAWLSRARRAAARRLRDLLPADVAPVAAALLVGIQESIDPATRRWFERTGTLHILAISGMHIVLLATAVHRLLRSVGVGPRAGAAVTLLLSAAYLPIAGGAAPIRRAVYGIGFYALSLVRGRPPDAFSALAGAAVLIALLDPADLVTVGFRLSFAATAGIALLAPPWSERWGRRHRLLARFPLVRRQRRLRLLAMGYLLRATPASLAAWLSTLALIAQAFGRVNPWAILNNLVAGPLLSLAVPLLALLTLGIGLLATPCALLLRAALFLLKVGADLPQATLVVPSPSGAAVVAYSLAAILLRRSLGASLPLFGIAIVLWACPPGTPGPGLWLLDVGHGQAALVVLPGGGVALLDAGSGSRPAIARRTILPALRALGIRRVDLLVCTQSDADHANAVPDLLEAIDVRRIAVGASPPAGLLDAARRRGIVVERARDGEPLLTGEGSRLLPIEPPPPARAGENDLSLSLLLEVAGLRILFPADREEAGLIALLDHGVPRCDTLVAPHHGAACAAAQAFGAAVRPRRLLVSAAAGFPDEPTLRAYGAREILRTAVTGCIHLPFPPVADPGAAAAAGG